MKKKKDNKFINPNILRLHIVTSWEKIITICGKKSDSGHAV